MEPGQTPSVLAISQGNGDPRRDSVYAVFLDSDGHFREHLKLDSLETMEESQHEAFTELLKRRRPQVVVVGGFTPNTRRLMAEFRTLAGAISSEIVENEMDVDAEEEEKALPAEEKARKRDARAAFESTYVNDEVARIYQNSARAATEFSELSPVAKYCVGLARYAQSPLNEYAALGQDLAALTYDANQKFVSNYRCLSLANSTTCSSLSSVHSCRRTRSSRHSNGVSSKSRTRSELTSTRLRGTSTTLTSSPTSPDSVTAKRKCS